MATPPRFPDIEALLAAFEEREEKAALLVGDDGGRIDVVLYQDLARRIRAASEDVRAAMEAERQEEGFTGCLPDVIGGDAAPEMIIRIFADLHAGRTVLMADPALPREIVDAAAEQLKGTDGKICFFTSGTSASSRVVILTQASLLTSAWSGQSMLACTRRDTILCVLPLTHVFGFVCGMLWGLCYSASVALGRGVRHLMDDCAFYRPTILPAVPVIIQTLDRFDMLNSELRVALIGAAPLPPAGVRSLQRRGTEVYLGYGLTETSSGIAITQSQDDPYALYPCPGADIQITEDGEITVATPCMMDGYLGEESPLETGPDGVPRLHTGDIGSFDADGCLRLAGRKKDTLILPDGTKIFCPECEAFVTEQTGDEEIAVCMRRDRPVLVAGRSGSAPGRNRYGSGTTAAMNAAAAGYERRLRLEKAVRVWNETQPRDKQIPEVMMIDIALPRTALGKIRRWKLEALIG